MSDIVERLHLMTSTHERHEFGIGDYWNICEDAADEIERLRADFADVCDKLAKENDANLKLVEDNATLRQALKRSQQAAPKKGEN